MFCLEWTRMGFRRSPCFQRDGKATHQRPLGAAACCSLCLLTCGLLIYYVPADVRFTDIVSIACLLTCGLLAMYVGLLTWLNTDMTKVGPDGKKRAHCCAPRWGGGPNTTCNAAGVCGTCCTAAPGSSTKIPCDLELPIIPEWAKGGSCAEEPRPACAKIRDTSEYIVKQTIGDTFPEVDKIQESEMIGFGMGERAQ